MNPSTRVEHVIEVEADGCFDLDAGPSPSLPPESSATAKMKQKAVSKGFLHHANKSKSRSPPVSSDERKAQDDDDDDNDDDDDDNNRNDGEQEGDEEEEGQSDAAGALREDWEWKKKRGNKAFKELNFELAAACYSESLEALQLLLGAAEEREKDSAGKQQEGTDAMPRKDQLSGAAAKATVLRPSKVSLLCNRAICYLKRAEDCSSFSPRAGDRSDGRARRRKARVMWRRCLSDCSAALELDPGHAKANYRKSRALDALGDHARALAAARLAKRAAPTAKDIPAWEAWLRAKESEREATVAAEVTAARAMARKGSGQADNGSSTEGGNVTGQGRSTDAEQAALEAAAAYLHVLGPTTTHTNATTGWSMQRKGGHRHPKQHLGFEQQFVTNSSGSHQDDAMFHWKHGPRDATEGALFAACRAIALCLCRQQRVGGADTPNDDDSASYSAAAKTLTCQNVAMGAARVAGGGLSALLKQGSRLASSMSASNLADDKSPTGSALRAFRATVAALMPKQRGPKSSSSSSNSAGSEAEGDPDEDSEDQFSGEDDDVQAADEDGGGGLCRKEESEDEPDLGITMSAALQAGAVAAYTTALIKGQNAAQAVGITQRVLTEGAHVGAEAAKAIATTMRDPDGAAAAAAAEAEAEDEALKPLLDNLPNDEAREGVKQLLKMTPAQVKSLPPEQREQIEKIRGMYAQHMDFAKQTAAAERARQKQWEESGNTGPCPPAPTSPPSSTPQPPKGAATTAEEKHKERREAEVKWLREFSEKNGKNLAAAARAAEIAAQQKQTRGANQGGAATAAGEDESEPVFFETRAEYDKAEAAQKAREAAAEVAEAAARRRKAEETISSMKQQEGNNSGGGGGSGCGVSGGVGMVGILSSSNSNGGATSAGKTQKVLGGGSGGSKKKRAKEKKKERTNQMDEIRRLAQSASALSFD